MPVSRMENASGPSAAGVAGRRVEGTHGLRATACGAAAVGLLAFLVGVIGSWIPSLWGDEAATVLSATRPLPNLARMLEHVDAVHGVSYVAWHFWIELFGRSAFSVRFPSAIAIGLCAAGVVWLCARFGSLRFGLLAGVCAAILPRLTWAAVEARTYAVDAALATLLCILVVEALFRARPRWRWWIAYAVTLAAGIYVFMYLVLMIPAFAVAIALMPMARSKFRAFLLWSALALVAASPVILVAIAQRRQIAFLSVRYEASWDDIWVGMWFTSTFVAVVAWLLILGAVAGWAQALIRARASGGNDPAVRLETLAIAWAFVPMGLLIASNYLLVPDFTGRYATISAPAVAILIAAGLRNVLRGAARVWHNTPMAVVAAAVCGCVLAFAIAPVWVSQRLPHAKDWSDWNDIASAIHQNARAGDGIVFDGDIRPSRRARLAMDTNPGPFREVKDLVLRTPYQDSDTWYASTYSIPHAAALGRFSGVDRVWLVETVYDHQVGVWGRSQLRALGYVQRRVIRLYSSEILLYTRTG